MDWSQYISFSHVDGMDEDRLSEVSDDGKGVEDMIDLIDHSIPTRRFYNDRIRSARRFVDTNAPRLLPVLNLILENGKDREESIWKLTKTANDGRALRKPTTARSKRFCGSLAAQRQIGDVRGRIEKS